MRIAEGFEAKDVAGGEWLSGTGADSDIVISSRVRLARNVKGHRFLVQAGDEEKAELEHDLRAALEPLLEKIHGQGKHVGKTPTGTPAADRSREKHLVALRRQLNASVKGENYELAAKLRDELKRAEAAAGVTDADS